MSGERRWVPPGRIVGVAGVGIAGTIGMAAICWHGAGPVLFDGPVTSLLTTAAPSTVRRVATRVVHLGNPLPQIIGGLLVAALVLLFLRDRWLALVCLLGPALAGLAEIAMKHLVARTRYGAPPDAPFYPSGHATGISSRTVAVVVVVFVLSASVVVRSIAVVAAILASVAMAASTIVLNDHYPTDAVGGLMLGSSITVLTAWALLGSVRTMVRARSHKKPP